jgi:glycosyltransferase involved in cell wall biosynthesis
MTAPLRRASGDAGAAPDGHGGRPGSRLRAALAALLGRVRRDPAATSPAGINLVGYARGGLGLGENLRRFAEAARRGGLPFALVDLDVNLGERGRDTRLDAWIGQDNPWPVNVFFVNADQMPAAREHFGEAFFAGRRNIGFWFWELEGFPAEWWGAFDLVDEVWVASRFVQAAISACTTKPVRRLALPVEVPLPRAFTRDEYGLPQRPFVFLFSFDFQSFVQRKNPRAAIEAFQRAFAPGDERAMLVVKSINGHWAPALLDEVRERIGADRRIVLLDGFLDRDAAMGLVSVADCYVSLHRSEGFGLGMAEAMALGKPAIGTAWSGNLDFMNEHNSCLVPATLVPVQPGEYRFSEGQRWAEPDVDAAAAQMRRLVDEPDFAARIGRAGAEYIAAHHSHAACLASMRSALAGGEKPLR